MNQTKEETYKEYLDRKMLDGSKVFRLCADFACEIALKEQKEKLSKVLQEKLEKVSYFGNEYQYCASSSREETLKEIINLLQK